MLRRLHQEQPESFAFTPDNQAWTEAQITKYPDGRQASAIIPLLWRAQEQEGWLSRPAIEHVADMLGMAHIRALEVATFYFMFQLTPVGSVAHVQVCGTTSCMICGAEDLVAACKDRIAPRAHMLSDDGKFSWEEVECLGACANAPMAQIGKDYYEDLTPEILVGILDELAAGRVPTPGPQQGRYASEPASGLTSLKGWEADKLPRNASVALAEELGDTVKRIDGTEVALAAPWGDQGGRAFGAPVRDDLMPPSGPDAGRQDVRNRGEASDKVSEAPGEAPETRAKARPAPEPVPSADAVEEQEPERLDAARDGAPDDLKQIRGVGPQLEGLLNEMGFYHLDQIASWGPAEIAWVDARLQFKGRIERDDWVAQARDLTSGS